MASALRTLLFIGELTIAATLIMALAMEAASALRGNAAMRHAVWLSAFLALLSLPLLATLIPSQIALALLPATPVETPAKMPSPSDLSLTSANATIPAAPVAASWHFDLATGVETLALAWLAGVLVIALRGGMAMVGLHKLRQTSTLCDMKDFALPDIGRAYELRVANAPGDCGPVTWGLFRPVILLPWRSRFWRRDQIETVLLHELAHIGRYDGVTQLLSMIGCALYWPHPLVWMGAKAMRNDAEIAADDAVIDAGVLPSSYASLLVQLASEFRNRQPKLAGVPLFMAAPSALETRVESILETTHSRKGVTPMDIVKLATAGLLAASVLAFARPSLAQDAPPPPPAPPAVEAPVPDAPPAPPAPPAPVSDAEMPVPPAPPSPPNAALPSDGSLQVMSETHDTHGHKHRHLHIIIDGNEVQTEQAMARVRPEIERALADAHAQERVAKIMEEVGPRMEAKAREEMRRAQPQIDAALAEARVSIDRADIDVKVREKVDAALKNAQIKVKIAEDRSGHHHDIEIDRDDDDAR